MYAKYKTQVNGYYSSNFRHAMGPGMDHKAGKKLTKIPETISIQNRVCLVALLKAS